MRVERKIGNHLSQQMNKKKTGDNRRVYGKKQKKCNFRFSHFRKYESFDNLAFVLSHSINPINLIICQSNYVILYVSAVLHAFSSQFSVSFSRLVSSYYY
jgi:hypothetical protein